MNTRLRFAMLSVALAIIVSACGGVSSGDADASVDSTGGSGDAGETDADIDEADAEPGLIRSTVFVTSSSHAPEFGSREGGDAICNELASKASLPGNYIAWLSVGAMGAAARMPTNRSWSRVDGQIVADGLAELVSGTVRAPISLDESGTPVESSLGVYTGTRTDGNAGLGDCDGWTASSTQSALAGSQLATDGTWTENDQSCGRFRSLYCFEI